MGAGDVHTSERWMDGRWDRHFFLIEIKSLIDEGRV
jgi:hypothetical protein